MAEYCSNDGLKWWHCPRCRQKTISIVLPVGNNRGGLRVERGSPSSPSVFLSRVPLDCDEAMVEGIMTS